MQLKKAKNSKYGFWLALLCLIVLEVFTPNASYAYTFEDPDLGIGTDEVCPGPGLTRRMVPCIKETLLSVTNTFLIPFSAYMADTVTVACVLALMLWAGLMITGKNSAPMRDVLVLGVKMGAVSMFTANFGGFLPFILDGMDELLGVVAQFVLITDLFGNNALRVDCHVGSDTAVLQIWDAVDCALHILTGGIFSQASLSMGILGFLISCLFSNAIGFAVGFIGIYLILQLLWAIVRAVYIFVSAYIGICLVVLISPIIIPTLLFTSTKNYFARWVRILGSFILQPIFLFAYLSMLMAAFNTVVYNGQNSLYRALVGTAVDNVNFEMPLGQCAASGSPCGEGGIGGWLWTNGAYSELQLAPGAINIDPRALRQGVNNNLVPDDAMNEGAMGEIASEMFNMSRAQQGQMMDFLGVGNTGRPRFFEVDIPVTTIDWDTLAALNGYPNDTASYLIKVLIAALMALITAYIFLEMLDQLPFLGSGIAMGTGMSDDKAMGLSPLGAGRLAPPGNDFMRRLQPSWGPRGPNR